MSKEVKTFIQWKGTDVCMDLNCSCGHGSHFDGKFAYYVKCPSCEQVYKLRDEVQVIPVDKYDCDPLESDTRLY